MGGASLGSAHAEITLDASGFAKGIASAQSQLAGFGSATAGMARSLSAGSAGLDDFATRADRVGSSLSRAAQPLALFGGAIAVGVGAAVNAFGSFEHEMNAVQAVTGATGDEFKALNDLALQIGQDTTFSASEAASALEELAKAGVSTEDILNGAAEGATALAAAAGEGIPQAATQIANALNQFALSGDQATHVADVFANVSAKSAADAQDFGDALAYVGTTAHGLDIPLEDIAASISVLADQGIKGSRAGTSLADAISSMVAPTAKQAEEQAKLNLVTKDAEGNFVGLTSVIEQVARATEGMGNAQRQAILEQSFGIEGARAMNALLQTQTPELQAAGKGWQDYSAAVRETGTAAEQAATRNKGLQGSLEAMRGSIETAAIAFGGALAPAMEKGASLITSLANGFSNLSPAIQQVGAGVVAAAGGFALLAAAAAKMVGFGFQAAANFSRLATVIRSSAAAAAAFSFAISPAGLVVGALAIGLGTLAFNHQRAAAEAQHHAEVMKNLTSAMGEFAKFVADLRLEGLTDAADDAENLGARVNDVAQFMLDNQKAFAKGGDEIVNWNGHLFESDALAFTFGKSAEALTSNLGSMQLAMRHSGVDVEKLSKHFSTLTEMLFRQDITPEQFTLAVTDITTHLDRYADTSKKAGDATNDLTAEQAKAAAASEAAAKALENFQQQTYASAQAAVEAVSGFKDLVPIMDGIQGGFNKVGTSAERAVLHMGKLGVVDLSPAERQALKLSENLNQVEVAITRTEGVIQQNADDMSMWAGRIQLVDDTLGTAEDGYAALNKLVDEGKLSQSEANKVLDDAIFLRERSVGGLEDERAEQAKNISVLADYVRQHDEAAGAVDNLTDSQQGFLTALQSTEGQTALQTIETLKYLESLGLIPPEKVTEVLLDMANSDPLLKALLQDLDLIPPTKDVAINAEDNASGPAGEILTAIEDIPTKKNVKVDLEFTPVGDGTELTDATVTELTVPTKLGAPDTSAVDSAVTAPKVIPTKLDAPDTSAVDSVTPETKHVPTILNAPMSDLVDNYTPDTVRVPTILDAPLADLVENYKPATIHIPTQLDNPTDAPGVHQGPSTLIIPTQLGAPDASVLTAYTEVPLVVPIELGPLPEVPQTDANAVTIPVEYGELPEVPTADIPTATIPTEYEQPHFGEGATLAIPTVIIPTQYDQPHFGDGATLAIPTVIIPTKYGEPPAATVPTIPDVTVKFAADTTALTNTLSSLSLGLALVATTYTATLEATDNASGPIQSATDNGTTFATTYTATIEATDNASGPISTAKSAADGFVGTYTATLAVDTSAAEAAIARLAKMLPSSPAKEGPLAFQPSFDYVSDAFASSMDAMVREAHKSMSRVADSLNKDLAVGVMSSNTAAQRSLDALKVASITGGGGIIQKHTHYHDDRTFAPLDPDHYLDLLVSAKEGREAYKNIRTRSRYG